MSIDLDAIKTALMAPEWAEGVPCAGKTDIMYPDCEPGQNFDWEPAKAICAGCPAIAPCLETALRQQEKFGCWGQTTPRERGEIAKRRADTLNCANCGTPVPRASRGGTLAWCHEQDCRRVRIRDAQRRLRARGAA